MDELLALLDENASADETENSSSTAVNDESVVAAPHAASAQHFSSRSSAPTRREHPDLKNQSRSNEPQGRVEMSIDKKLGIRMMNRKLSSIDLMDMVSTHPYHSTASIAAMSLVSLNRLLVEPTSVVSAATVSGKTNIMTVGIVFTNSGTRISGNGRAFSVLTIGNLETGPVVTVFLFGEVYSKHCAKCPPGTVIALLSPSLLPPKEDAARDTTVSLSVSDSRQFLPVAKARDYAICKATVSTKRADGQWISHGGRCKHHVDMRISLYCEKHRKQANTKNGPVQKKQTFIQQQRMERDKGVLTMQMPGVGTVVTHKPPPSIEEELQELKSKRFGTNAPRHMNKQATPLVTPQQSRFRGTASSRQPTMQANNTSAAMSRPATHPSSSRVQSKSTPVTGDWLGEGTKMQAKKKTPLTGQKRVINKDMAGYDGSVAIPKPNKMFRHTAASLPRAQSTAAHQQALMESKVNSVREQQRLLAQRHKENTLSRGPNARKPVTKRGSSKRSSDDALKDSLFGQFDSMDTAQLLNTKSRFSDEADAEAYAKSRHAVMELERKEEQKMQSNKKQRESKEKAIQIEFVCRTCKKTTKSWPKVCARANHKVERRMDIKKSDTVQERRLKLDEKSVEDGGLKLGAGLEWDRRRY